MVATSHEKASVNRKLKAVCFYGIDDDHVNLPFELDRSTFWFK